MNKINRNIALVLVTAVLLWMAPAAAVMAAPDARQVGMRGKTAAGKDTAEAAKNQVVVLYEDGEVPADDSGTQRRGAKGKDPAKSAQEKIIGNALDGDFTIDDTIIIESSDENAEDMVIGVVSSDEYSSEQLAETLENADGIKYAEPNIIFRINAMPDWNDKYLKEAWQLGEKGLNIDKAPEAAHSGDPIVLAVMDTGIDYTHPDLEDRMWTAPDGFVLKGEHGVDWSDGDDDPMDENGHGTHCAGIIAAAANNGEGVAGVAGDRDSVRLMGVRVLDAEGSGYLEDIVKGFKYLIRAKKAGVNIKAVNCSFGANETSDIFDEVIEQAGQAGILTIAAAGNESSNNDSNNVCPANSKSDYVIAVAATDSDGSLASYSNYGRRSVDVAAPGTNILSSVSYYNYAPYLYDAATIKATTQVYGEFGGAAVETDPDTGKQSVTPVLGTDYDGGEITGVGTFGPSVMFSVKSKGSEGEASLEITDGSEAGAFAVGNNQKSLRWKIENAKAGDEYVLYFPYEKIKGEPYINMAFSTHAGSGDDDGSGTLMIGDVKITHIDAQGGITYSASAEETMYGVVVDPTSNGIWQASGLEGALYDTGAISGVSSGDYGLGFVYYADTDGEVYIDISSLAISAKDADAEDFGMYDLYSGTSMATPAVTGAVGIIASSDPGMGAEELKAAVLGTTTSAGTLSGKCSTGGRVDFTSYSSEESTAKPAVSSVTADFAGGKVIIKGKGFGDAPDIKVFRNTAPEGEDGAITIDAADIEASGDTITISNAGYERYGLIGSDIRFEITNGDKKGESSNYIVKGLDPYDDEFTTAYEEQEFEIWDKDSEEGDEGEGEEEEDPVMPQGLRYVSGADDLYKYSAAGDIYCLTKHESNGKVYAEQRGPGLSEAVSEYGKKMAETEDLWLNDDNEEEPVYNCGLVADPVYSGDVIYELVCVDMVDRDAYLLMGLDLNEGTDSWKVYYDSLSGFGTKPDELNFRKIESAELAAYGGKIYLLGCSCGEQYDEASDEYTADISKDVYSCMPNIKGSEWVQEGSLPEARTNGMALVSNGKLYYFFTNDEEGEIDYGIYAYDGESWTKAGELPKALFADSEGATISFVGDIIMITIDDTARIICAVGVDSKGILFAGKSFDGPGDTFRFNTETNKIEPLKYTLWGTVSDRVVDGNPYGDRFVVEYTKESTNEAVAKSFPIESGYVKIEKSVSGDGSGSVIGGGSYVKGDVSAITITPEEGSYIYSVSTNGLSPDLEKEYGKATTESKGTLTTTFDAKGDASIDVEFGLISTKVIVPEGTITKAVGKRRIDAHTDGTISGVTWKSSNTKYASVNKDGTITFKKAGIGKTVTLTATSVEDKTLKATCKVKIVSRELTKFNWSGKKFTTKTKVQTDLPLAKARTPKKFKVKKQSGKAVLTWAKVKGVSGYIVLRRTGNGRFVQVAKVAQSKSSWTDKKVKKGKKYRYVVVSYSTVKNSKSIRISPASAVKKFKR